MKFGFTLINVVVISLFMFLCVSFSSHNYFVHYQDKVVKEEDGTFIITDYLRFKEGYFYFDNHDTSRSRVTVKMIPRDEELRKKLMHKKNKLVNLRVSLYKEYNPWSKVYTIEEIVK